MFVIKIYAFARKNKSVMIKNTKDTGFNMKLVFDLDTEDEVIEDVLKRTLNKKKIVKPYKDIWLA